MNPEPSTLNQWLNLKNWLKKYWFPLTMVLLAIVFVFAFDSVETIDLDTRYSATPSISTPNIVQLPLQKLAPAGVGRLRIGARYNSGDHLMADQRSAGYVKLGTFGNHWPATVTEIDTGNDSISFTRQDGVKHSYTKFDGYAMKIVRLNARGKETVIVFRSESKQ